jgi:hypothetical protein
MTVYSVDRKKRGMAGHLMRYKSMHVRVAKTRPVGNNKDGVTRQPGIEH